MGDSAIDGDMHLEYATLDASGALDVGGDMLRFATEVQGIGTTSVAVGHYHSCSAQSLRPHALIGRDAGDRPALPEHVGDD